MQQKLFSVEMQADEAAQRAFYQKFFSISDSGIEYLESLGLVDHVSFVEACVSPLSVPVRSRIAVKAIPPKPADADYQFAYVTDSNFAAATCASMLSIIYHTQGKGSVKIIVLGDRLSQEDTAKFFQVASVRQDVDVEVHDVTRQLDRDVGNEDAKRATFGRIYLVDFVGSQKTLYLDGDVLATKDFTELFKLNLQHACLAGVTDSAALRIKYDPQSVPEEQTRRMISIVGGVENIEDYLNGGVLLMDFSNPEYTKLALRAKVLIMQRARDLVQRDQDAMNMIFSGKKMVLPARYNFMTQFYNSDRATAPEIVQRKYESIDATFIHFSGKVKPWLQYEEEFYNALYRRMVENLEKEFHFNCGLYFSCVPAVDPNSIAAVVSGEFKAHAKRATRRGMDAISDGVKLLCLTDSGAILQVNSDMLTRLRDGRYELTGYASGSIVFQVPVSGLESLGSFSGPPSIAGVTKLPFDLASSVLELGGVARDLHVYLGGPTTKEEVQSGRRHLGSLAVFATSSAFKAEKLANYEMDGVIDRVVDGIAYGWLRNQDEDWTRPVAVYLNGMLVDLVIPKQIRPGLSVGNKIGRGFCVDLRFFHLNCSEKHPASIDLRSADTNLPLRRSPIVMQSEGDYTFDKTVNTFVRAPKKSLGSGQVSD